MDRTVRETEFCTCRHPAGCRWRAVRENQCPTDTYGTYTLYYTASADSLAVQWPETHNLVFGRTTNPHNRSLTSGGSSGGEGALISLRGSPLGVGSDIGGSIRIPAAFCGLYGLRPSYGRVPYAGAVNSLQGQDSVPSVFGPMCNSISGIKVFMQAVIDQRPWLKDPLAVRKPWDEEAYRLSEHGGGRKLCFAVMWDDDIVIPHPPIIRGLELTKKALLAAGHRGALFVSSACATG